MDPRRRGRSLDIPGRHHHAAGTADCARRRDDQDGLSKGRLRFRLVGVDSGWPADCGAERIGRGRRGGDVQPGVERHRDAPGAWNPPHGGDRRRAHLRPKGDTHPTGDPRRDLLSRVVDVGKRPLIGTRPERDPVPIGPVFTGEERELSQPSPDTEEIRQHLLSLLGRIEERPRSEYPIGVFTDEAVVWQLGEFKEARAVEALRRVVSFDPNSAEAGPFGRTRHSLVQLAEEALTKIQDGSA